MEMPKYHLRVLTDTKAAVFKIGLTEQRRIRWERCASVSVKTGKITMEDGVAEPQDLAAFCQAGIATFIAAKAASPEAYKALKTMGQLAEKSSTQAGALESDLFEMLIWAEADLKNGLVANKGLALLGDDDQEKYILQGQQYMNEGRFKDAEDQYVKALGFRANRANVQSFLSVAFARQGKLAEAAKAIDNSNMVNPGNIGSMLRGAQYNLAAGRTKLAQGYIENLATSTGVTDEQKLHISRLAVRAELPELGLKVAKALVAEGQGEEAALEHLVNLVAAQAGEKAVFEIVRPNIKDMPKPARLKEWYLRTLIADDALEQADIAAKSWIESEGSAQAHFQSGRVFMAMKKPRRALRALERSAELAPDSAPCHKLIADAYMALNDLPEAAKASEKACRLAPENQNFINQSKRITELLMQSSAKG